MAAEVQVEDGVTSGIKKGCLTECPLCLQQLRYPRSLPCLHSFCEECLKASILSQSKETDEKFSFQCPVCRIVTRTVDPKRDEWATEFVANKLITDLMSQSDGDCKQYNCFPCGKREQKDTIATVWWKEGNKYLCDSCKNDLISEDDTLVSIDEDFLPTSSLCSKHSTNIDMICDDHHSTCCPKCIAIDHRRCDMIRNYGDFVRNMRTTSQMEDTKKKFQNAIDELTLLVNDLKARMEELLGDRNSFIKNVKELRAKIEGQLDELQKALSDEAHAAFDEKKQELDNLIRKCELIKGSIITTKTMTETERIQKNDMHMVRTLQKGEMEIKAGRRLVKEIAEPYLTEGMKHKVDKPDQNNSSEDEQTEKEDETAVLLSALSLGSLETTCQKRDFPVQSRVLLPQSLLEARELNEMDIKTQSDNFDCQITGMVYLSDLRLLVSDNGNEKLKMFSADGNLMDELKISDCRDICMKNAETVAVAQLDEGKITHVRIESKRKLEHDSSRDLFTGRSNDTVALGKDCYVVGTSNSRSDVIFEAIGNHVRDLTWYCTNPKGLAYDPQSDSVLYTEFRKRDDDDDDDDDDMPSVTRILANTDKVKMARISDEVTGATGLDLDQDGNIYVCCSKKITQISRHGRIRHLVDISDPYRISVCERKFAVGLEKQSVVKFFELC